MEVSKFLYEHHCNIVDSAQYTDHFSERFFMRIHFEEINESLQIAQLEKDFLEISKKFEMDAQFFNLTQKPRVFIMVSKFGHCLNDLLFRSQSGNLPIQIVGIGSNHQDFAELAKSYSISYHYFSVTSSSDERKLEAEKSLLEIIENSFPLFLIPIFQVGVA